LFAHILSKDLEAHKATLSLETTREVERFKAHLAIAASEHQLRFGKLHEKRVEVLADLFTRCSDLDASLKILKVKIERELLTDPGRMEKAIDDLGNRAHAAQKLFNLTACT